MVLYLCKDRWKWLRETVDDGGIMTNCTFHAHEVLSVPWLV